MEIPTHTVLYIVEDKVPYVLPANLKYQASTPCAPCQGRDAGHNSFTSPTRQKLVLMT